MRRSLRIFFLFRLIHFFVHNLIKEAKKKIRRKYLELAIFLFQLKEDLGSNFSYFKTIEKYIRSPHIENKIHVFDLFRLAHTTHKLFNLYRGYLSLRNYIFLWNGHF